MHRVLCCMIHPYCLLSSQMYVAIRTGRMLTSPHRSTTLESSSKFPRACPQFLNNTSQTPHPSHFTLSSRSTLCPAQKATRSTLHWALRCSIQRVTRPFDIRSTCGRGRRRGRICFLYGFLANPQHASTRAAEEGDGTW